MTDRNAPSETTRYGFRFGAALVERTCELDRGRVVIGVTTDSGKRLDVYVSATGRSVRVFSEGREWRASVVAPATKQEDERTTASSRAGSDRPSSVSGVRPVGDLEARSGAVAPPQETRRNP